MNHYAWTHVAGAGRNTNIGLYHSSTTGHLMIYAGKKIVTIDFKVLDSKEYTFFIDEELCRIKLERRGDEMYYFFEIDKETDTPLNRRRWAREKKHLRQMVIVFGILALLVAAVVIWSKVGTKERDTARLLSQKGVETFGKLTEVPDENGGDIQFQFISDEGPQTGKLSKKVVEGSFSYNKFPLEKGDEFIVKYVPNRPHINSIYLLRPTEKQVKIYREKTLARLADANPDLAPETMECFLDVAQEVEGLDGWALFYFQKTPPSENAKYNSETFQKFFQSYLFQGEIKKRCLPE